MTDCVEYHRVPRELKNQSVVTGREPIQREGKVVVSTNLVVQASKCIQAPPKPDPLKHQRLLQVRADLLPAEAAARVDADRLIADLERCARAEEKGKRLGLSVLSPEIFSWRNGTLPSFAPFAVDGDGECVISSNPAKQKVPESVKGFYQHVFPEPLTNRIEKQFTEHFKAIWCLAAFVVEACYFYNVQADASATWGKFALGLGLGILASFCASLMFLILLIAGWTLLAREVERTAVARFAGTIPMPVRDRIRQFSHEFREILIVAEAQWQQVDSVKAIKMPAACDPLVVGWDGDFFWLIDRFDTSTLEQLASDEFAVKADSLTPCLIGSGA